jgi:hypothetical protein
VKTTVIGKAYNFNVCFGAQTLTGNAGIVLMRDFVEKIWLPKLIDDNLNVKGRQRGYPESENVLSLCWNAILGGNCLLDLNVLRGDAGLPELLGVESIMAPTTAGEFLRCFKIGQIGDLRRINRLAAESVRSQQKSDRLTIDLDASLYEQCSRNKQGSRMNYKGEVGYYPLFAFWAEEGEMLQAHLQSGNAGAASKSVWFLEQALIQAPKNLSRYLRADSEFYKWELLDFCDHQEEKITYAITADQSIGLMEEITSLPEKSWKFYAPGAQVVELMYAPTNHEAHRYVVKRQQVKDKKKGLIWRHHIVITNEYRLSPKKLMKWALGRCTMENLIKEHKNDFGFEKMPTQRFHANWAWLLISQLAWNLMAWFKRLYLPQECHSMTLGTLRHRLLKVAGKIVHQGRQLFLILTEKNYFQDWWSFALNQLSPTTGSSS